jgi:flagellar hook-associated protein 3 FlgL
VRQVELAPGVLERVSVRADVIVKGAGGGVDVLQTMRDLAAALAANDVPAIRNAFGALDAGLSQISKGMAEVSASVSMLDAADEVNLLARDQVQTQIARLADADIMESAGKLALANHALEAALTASAKSFDLSLLDRLR